MTAAQKAAQKAYAARQKAATAQHSTAVTVAQGTTPDPTGNQFLGPTATQGIYGKGYAAPVVSPQPFDPALEAQKTSAIRNIGLGDAEAGWQKGQLQRSSGFDSGGNLIGVGSADFNPFSQAQIFQDDYKRSVTGTNNSMAAQGQLYSGARLNAQAHNDRGYAQGYDALKTGALTGYHGIQSGQLSNYATNISGVSDADFGALRKQVYGS